MALDGVNYLTETVGKISAQPLKAVTSWVADKAAPSYWRPNFDIIVRTSSHFTVYSMGSAFPFQIVVR